MIPDLIARLRKLHAELSESDGGECEATALYREAAEALEAAAALLKYFETTPHMCRDEHPEVKHALQGETCPVCDEKRAREKAEADRAVLVESIPTLVATAIAAEREKASSGARVLREALTDIEIYACHGPDCAGGAGNRCSCGYLQADAKARAALSSCPSDG